MATYTIGDGGYFATITAALASGSGVVPGDTLALLPGYNNIENATVGIENLTFSGDASNAGITLWLGTGIMAITLTGSAPITVRGNESDNSITGNDGGNYLTGFIGNDSINGGVGDDTISGDVGNDTLTGGEGRDRRAGGGGNDSINGGAGDDLLYGDVGNDTLTGGEGNDTFWYGDTGNDSINGDAGNDTIYYLVGDDFVPGDGIDAINGGPDHDTLSIFGTYPDEKGFGGNNSLNVVVVNGAITSIAGGTLANVESVVLDLSEGWDGLDYAGTTEAVTVNLATGTATGFTSIAGVENVSGAPAMTR